MCAVLPIDATMTAHLTLAYREATAATDSVLAAAGEVVRAHEFHRTETDPESGPNPAWLLASADPATSGAPPARQEGHVTRNVHASYLHVHWAGYPRCAHRFAAACHAAANQGAPA